MIVRMVRIWEMRVRMREHLMAMPMPMFGAGCYRLIVFVLMVFVVCMFVFVLHRLVLM